MIARLDKRSRTGISRQQPRRKLQLTTTTRSSNREFTSEIVNLSANGLLLKTDDELALDEPIMVVLPHAGDRPARIVWHADDLYGCHFSDPLSEEDLAAALGDADGDEADDEEEEASETFGRRLRRLRIKSGRSMVALAKLAGVTKPTLWKWETDKVRPRPAALSKLADIFSVDEMHLLYGRKPQIGTFKNTAATLEELVKQSRTQIARVAGVSENKVGITIEWS